jgi:hypothetical protein
MKTPGVTPTTKEDGVFSEKYDYPEGRGDSNGRVRGTAGKTGGDSGPHENKIEHRQMSDGRA